MIEKFLFKSDIFKSNFKNDRNISEELENMQWKMLLLIFSEFDNLQ